MKTNFSIVVLVFAVLIGLLSVYSISGVGNSDAATSPQDEQIAQQIRLNWEYGLLTMNRENNTYKFTYGDEISGTERGTSLENLSRIMGKGRNNRATFANLMNSIGTQGWELTLIESGAKTKTWIFKRDF